MIRDRCDAFLVSLLPPDIGAKTIEEAMTAIARNYLGRVLMPSSISLYRLLMAEAPRVPELGEISYKAGAARAVANLARYLEEKMAKGTRSEEHTSELTSLMRISYAVFCLQKKT